MPSGTYIEVNGTRHYLDYGDKGNNGNVKTVHFCDHCHDEIDGDHVYMTRGYVTVHRMLSDDTTKKLTFDNLIMHKWCVVKHFSALYGVA